MENGISRTVWLAVAGALAAWNAPAALHIQPSVSHIYGEVIVKSASPDASFGWGPMIQSLERELGEGAVLSLRSLQTDSSVTVMQLAQDQQVKKAIARLAQNPGVLYAEPNYRVHAFDLPNDADFAKLWGLHNTGQKDSKDQEGKAGSDISAVKAWNAGHTGSKKVLVAVIDTGVSWDHEDLVDNVYTNTGESGSKANNGKDDDNNGFVDDTHGWNFADDNRNSKDDNDHGTHCAGTIGGKGNNGIGVVGVNWKVSILPIKFLDSNGGGSTDDAIDSVNYATQMGVNIMSNSWGGGGASDVLKEAIEKARDAGILFVAAAGNASSNNDLGATYPANYEVENVLSVAATDNLDKLATFSNYGRKTVHLAAPGVNILSTTVDGYNTFSGTSMATPHVAGAAALLLAAEPGLTYAQVKDRLIRSSDVVGAMRRKTINGGRLNVFNAIRKIFPERRVPDPTKWVDVVANYESEHPYKDNVDKDFEIKHPGAKYMRVHFKKFDLEEGYDFVTITNGNGDEIEAVNGVGEDFFSDFIEGDTATLNFTSDYSNQGYGFKVDKIQVITE